MTKYREIIRLTSLGFSQRDIMASCGIAQKTVVKVQKRAKELSLTWPLDESMTDIELQKLMFSHESKVSANKRIFGSFSVPHSAFLVSSTIISRKAIINEPIKAAILHLQPKTHSSA